MSLFTRLPNELLCQIVEQLVISIGICKAVRLRSVNRKWTPPCRLLFSRSPHLGYFNEAILQAICVSQVVDIDDPAISPSLRNSIPASLRGRIYLTKSRTSVSDHAQHLSVIADVNLALDNLTHPYGKYRDQQHQLIAQAVAGSMASTFAGSFPFVRFDSIFKHFQINAERKALHILCGAIIIGDLSLVERLLWMDSSLDIDAESPFFGRPLPLAAAWGHFSIVEYLLQLGANPHLGPVSKAYDADFHPSFQDCFREISGTPLQAATQGGHEDIVRLLLKPQYRRTYTEGEYLQAIIDGAHGGHLNIIKLLLQVIKRDITDIPGRQQILWEAVRHNHTDIAELVLRSGIDVNSFPAFYRYPMYESVLNVAAAQGNIRMVQRLLDAGCDVTRSGDVSYQWDTEYRQYEQPIESAARCGQVEVVKLLLEKGANPIGALYRAAESGQARVIQLLLGKVPGLIHNAFDASRNVGPLALRIAIEYKNPTIISLLVDAGVPINDMSDYPRSYPNFIAKVISSQWIVDYLISIGARDHEFSGVPNKSDRFSELYLETFEECSPSSGGTHVTRRTWEWAGKY